MTNKIIRQIEPNFNYLEKKELQEAISSTYVSEGPKTRLFESKLANFLKVPYAVTVPNGTLALTISCLVLGLKSDDEIIIPDLTMAGSLTSFLILGIKPIFVDISFDNLNIDVNLIEKVISKKTKAIMPVHLNGRPADMDQICKLAKKYHLYVIEDAAQAFGSKYNNKYLGTIGDIGCFSFSVPKIITTGQGGLVVTRNKKLFQRILKLKDFGRVKKGLDIHDEIGFNFKFTDLQAAIGLAQFSKISKAISQKKDLYLLYQKLLADIKTIKFIQTDLTQTVPWFIDIIVEDRGTLQKFLNNHGIETRNMYPPLHSQTAYQKLVKQKYNFKNTIKLSAQILWLPSSVNLEKQDVVRICQLIKKFYALKK